MINALPHSLRELASKFDRQGPELYRLLAAPILVGFIIGWTGAYGDRRAAAACIWSLLALASWLINDLFTRPFATPLHRRRYPLAVVLFAGFVVSAPLSVLLNLSFGEIFLLWGIQRNGLDALASLSSQRMISSSISPLLLWLGINILACRINGGMLFGHRWSSAPERALQPEPRPAAALDGPAFMRKVKPALRSKVIAINAELHYVRVFTEHGEDLIHYRFRDAVADMQALGGIQVHRSWCVSADEIAFTSSQSVGLQSGLSVSVGRIYKQELIRRAGFRSWSNFGD